MKYTRYDVRRKKRGITVTMMFLALFLCVLIALSIYSKYFFKIPGSANAGKADKTSSDTPAKNSDSKSVDFIILQCGIFQDANNLDNEKKMLSQYGNIFTVDSNEGTRVYMGIFSDSKKSGDLSKTLSDNQITNIQATYAINKSDICNAEIVEIINASIQIVDKLSQKDVKSYKTEELKKWCSGLQNADSKSKNYNSLTECKKFISQMPDEINKDYITKIYVFMFNQIKTVGVKK